MLLLPSHSASTQPTLCRWLCTNNIKYNNNNNTIRSFANCLPFAVASAKSWRCQKKYVSRLRGLWCVHPIGIFFFRLSFFSPSSFRDRKTENDATFSFRLISRFRWCECLSLCNDLWLFFIQFLVRSIFLWYLCFALPFGNTFRVSNFITRK